MIDWSGVDEATREGLLGISERWGRRAVLQARRHAPVRKIFKGQGTFERERLKSVGEIEKDRSLRKRLGLGPEYGPLNPQHVAPATILTKYAPQELGQRRIGVPGVSLKLRSAQQRLDHRGRAELKSMRAAHKGNLGGRLRDEIYATAAKVYGEKVRTTLVSPTPYGKYQELGTRHNPAHPYLRPGAYETVDGVRDDLRRTMPGVVAPHLHATIPVIIRI